LQEDTFAPVLSIVTVADEAEAVRLSNNCPYALGASVFTRDKSAGRRVAAQLNAGFVSINDLIVPSADPRVPFGGRAASGFGATRGAEGLLELTTAKVISVSGAKFRPAFDAPRPRDEQLIQSHLKLAHGRGFGRRWRALAGILSSVFRRHETKQGKAT
jgi:delta 1-pyrroline-5-carboxylate dehydrogenase